MLQLSCVQVQV